MLNLNIRASLQISNSPGNLKYPVISTSREPQPLHRILHQCHPNIINMTILLQLFGRDLGIAINAWEPFIPLRLDLPGSNYPVPDALTPLRTPGIRQFFKWYRNNFNLYIDPVKQRPGDFAEIFLYNALPTGAGGLRVVVIAAGTGIHGCNEHKTRRVIYSEFCPGDGDVAILQGLPQDLQHRPLKFRQLIEKENAIMSQGNFTWLRKTSSTNKCDVCYYYFCCGVKILLLLHKLHPTYGNLCNLRQGIN